MKTTTRHLYALPFIGTKQLITNHFLLVILALVGAQAHATTIDFGQYPAGTLASQANPYPDILNIQAEWGFNDGYGINGGSVPATESYVVGGDVGSSSIYKRDGALAILPGVQSIGQHFARLSVSFLEPVTAVSFNAFAERTAPYQYFGVNGTGDIFSGAGVVGLYLVGHASEWQSFNLDLPDGYFLTSFTIQNQDIVAADAAIWIRDISFTPVPDSANTMPCLLFTCVCLFLAVKGSVHKGVGPNF